MVSTLRLYVCFLAFLAISSLAGCSSTIEEGKPLPDLTFEHLAPLPVNVAVIEIVNRYTPGSDPRDQSSSFPTPPDVVLRRYAENRLQAAGAEGILKFVIEDASIHHSLVQPAGKFTGWLGINRKDLYEIFMKIRLYGITPDGQESTHAILNMKRSIAIPQGYTLAEKEEEKFKFLEVLMKDVDKAVTTALHEKINLVSTGQSYRL